MFCTAVPDVIQSWMSPASMSAASSTSPMPFVWSANPTGLALGPVVASVPVGRSCSQCRFRLSLSFAQPPSGVRVLQMGWYWMDVGPDGGRAVCEEFGLCLVVVVEPRGTVGFLGFGDTLLRVVEGRGWVN